MGCCYESGGLWSPAPAPNDRLLTITPDVLTQACALVQAYPLRAYDALHLACALAARQRLQQHGAPGRRFVAADMTLLAAASAEGFLGDNPLQYP